MNIHYFQRYHGKENVMTANTMLLLSRFYSYSSSMFFQFLKEQFYEDSDFEPEVSLLLQDSGKTSVPDATISQPSMQFVIETKRNNTFDKNQLRRHLSKFKNEDYKVLITLSPKLMKQKDKKEVDKIVEKYNLKHKTNIIHANTTFEELTQGIQSIITERDYEMQDILDDYCEYCYHDKLIIVSDAWKKMRMKLAGQTLDFNIENNVYYDSVNHGFSPHEYLALYKNKSIRAVGRIEAIITAINVNGKLQYDVEKGDEKITKKRKDIINKAREEAKGRGWNLDAERYFFVEKFYETDYPKKTKYAPMGARVFDLLERLNIDKIPDTEQIAELLRKEEWE